MTVYMIQISILQCIGVRVYHSLSHSDDDDDSDSDDDSNVDSGRVMS